MDTPRGFPRDAVCAILDSVFWAGGLVALSRLFESCGCIRWEAGMGGEGARENCVLLRVK